MGREIELEEIDWKDCLAPALASMPGPGLLLTAGKEGNPITVGWLTFGITWGLPIVQAMIRPSRYSFELMEGCKEFVINIPAKGMNKELAICGSKSGRDIDKIKECGLTLTPGRDVDIPYIQESLIHLECRTVHTNNVINSTLDKELSQKFFGTGDFHKIYWGEIVKAFLHK